MQKTAEFKPALELQVPFAQWISTTCIAQMLQ